MNSFHKIVKKTLVPTRRERQKLRYFDTKVLTYDEQSPIASFHATLHHGSTERKCFKTSVFHETFAKSDNEGFQNEHFPRDIRKK